MECKAEWKSIKKLFDTLKKRENKDLPKICEDLIIFGTYPDNYGQIHTTKVLGQFDGEVIRYNDNFDKRHKNFIPLFYDTLKIGNEPKISLSIRWDKTTCRIFLKI